PPGRTAQFSRLAAGRQGGHNRIQRSVGTGAPRTFERRGTMNNDVRRNGVLAVAALLLALEAAACSKSGPTAPGGGYGGGGTGGGNTGGTTFNFGPFAIGQSASFTFASSGTFGYHCIPHRAMGMVGSVQVDASGSDSAVVRIAVSGFSFTPAAVQIKTGGHVRWVNASSSAVHTVTSD